MFSLNPSRSGPICRFTKTTGFPAKYFENIRRRITYSSLGFQLQQSLQESLVRKVSLHDLPGHILVMAAYRRQPQLFQVSFKEQALFHGSP